MLSALKSSGNLLHFQEDDEEEGEEEKLETREAGLSN